MFNQRYASPYLRKKVGVCLGLIALTSVPLLFSGCAQPEEVSQGNTTIEEVQDETEQLIGQTVSIRGDVEEPIRDSSFLIESDEFFGGEQILVINATGMSNVMPSDDTPVQVTGEVAQFTIADIERDYGLGLDPQLYAEYEQKPAIIAKSIALAPEPEDLAENPEAYYNRVVAVEGEVAQVYSPDAFTIGEAGWFNEGELLVIGVTPDFGVGDLNTAQGERVTVTGVLRTYVDAEFERDYDLTWDLDIQQQIEAEYQQKPVLAGMQIYPSAMEQ